ncbi:hypothetical protein E2C01_015460 [Portunus trituberculatus]|uniref:Uncharacterized protein n=1 Tax=Portunus trituberculatus TaxID=210409 RepID=A0A5B7DN92_PORTR|nr:hypothetical protein [Portunus trituberculatus]
MESNLYHIPTHTGNTNTANLCPNLQAATTHDQCHSTPDPHESKGHTVAVTSGGLVLKTPH